MLHDINDPIATDNLFSVDFSNLTFNADSGLLTSTTLHPPPAPQVITNRSTPTTTNTYAKAVRQTNSQASLLPKFINNAISKKLTNTTLLEPQYQQIATKLIKGL